MALFFSLPSSSLRQRTRSCTISFHNAQLVVLIQLLRFDATYIYCAGGSSSIESFVRILTVSTSFLSVMSLMSIAFLPLQLLRFGIALIPHFKGILQDKSHGSITSVGANMYIEAIVSFAACKCISFHANLVNIDSILLGMKTMIAAKFIDIGQKSRIVILERATHRRLLSDTPPC
jgi:hypothetical protein